MSRPAVDVVVPFAGSQARLEDLVGRLALLETRPGDTIVVADNRPGATAFERAVVRVIAAGDFRGSYHARNRAARLGSAPWLLFLDADVLPGPCLLDDLFASLPGERTGVLAGAVRDAEPTGRSAAARYAWLKSSMSQEHTLGQDTPFAQTANCAVRRAAFEQLGGFADEVRSGGDADLCLRLAAAGWALESRPGAVVVHRNRQTVPRLLAQRARHGAGAAWVGGRHPGSLPARSLPGVAWWGIRRAIAGLRSGDRDERLVGLLDGPAVLAFELGRRLPNRRVLQPRRRQ